MARLFRNVSTDKISFAGAGGSGVQTFVVSQNCSAVAWVYTLSQAAMNPIFGANAGPYVEWRINLSGQMEFLTPGGTTWATSTGVVPNGRWTHVGINWAGAFGTNCSFFINGRPAGTTTVTTPSWGGASTIQIGNNNINTFDNFNGMIWDFAAWARNLLTPAQMAQLGGGLIRATSIKLNPQTAFATRQSVIIAPLDEDKFAGLNLAGGGPAGAVSGTLPARSPTIPASRPFTYSSAIAAARFRRTLSSVGTHIGGRQAQIGG